MISQLADQVGGVAHGDHVCLIYDTPEEQLAATVPFLREGLARRQRCVYLGEASSFPRLTAALARRGVDVQAETRRGMLLLTTPREVFLPGGSFDPGGMVDFLRRTAESALADECSGLRVTGEMSWALGPEPGCDRLIEYEAMLNDFFPASSVAGLCQYDRQRFPPEVIEGVLRTHPIAILGDQLCPNLYFEPPEMVMGGSTGPHRLAWMISQLKKAHTAGQELQDASAAKSSFLATISHELRTPLNAIVGYTELMGSGLAGELTHPQQGHLARIGANTQHLLQIIEELLTFSRMEAGKELVRLEGVELNALLRDTARLVEPRATAKGLSLRVELPDTPTLAETDPGKVRQIVLTLLSNAVKFTERGELSLSLAVEHDLFVLRVRDTGIGVRPELREEIFAPFRQADEGLTRRADGAGLGLAVARGLAETLGGAAFLESTTRTGSTFTVRLPRNLRPSY